MTVLRLCVALCAGAIVIGSPETDFTDTTTEESTEESTSVTTETEYNDTISFTNDGWRLIASDSSFVINIPYRLVDLYYTCQLNNSVTGEIITCKGTPSHYMFDCDFICSRYALHLAKRNKLDPGIWNLIGIGYSRLQTAFEVARVGSVHKHRSVKFKPEKLKSEYSTCKLQNEAGTTIYCKSVDGYAELDKAIDCNDVCTTFVNCVADVEKIKGNWTLIGEINNSSSQTGFEILVGSPETDYTDTTTVEVTEVSTSATTETEYMDAVSFMKDLWQYITLDRSFVIRIPYRLVGEYYTCHLNNSVTGEIITCKGPQSYYLIDCNHLCSHYALNLAKKNKLDTGIWNLIGKSRYGEFHTAFEIARVGSVQKRRSVKYKPEKLKSEYTICKLQNQAGTTIYCKSVQRYHESDKVDCNDVCAAFVDCVADVDKIKGNWTLIGESNNGSSQTGFEILVGTPQTEYTETIHLSDDGWRLIASDSNFVITIPYKLVELYYTCKLQNSVTGETITCKGPRSYQSFDCNFICSHYALNLAKENKLDTGIWNLIGESIDGRFHTAFEIARVGGERKHRSVKYDPEKLIPRHSICKLQNQAGTTIYCKSVDRSAEPDVVDCNDVCSIFVNCVTDVEKIKGNWTLIGESNNSSSQTGFEILVGTPETGYMDTTTEEATEETTSVTTETEYTDSIHLSDDGWRLIASDSSFVITIPYRLVELCSVCQLRNSATGEIITCKGSQSYYHFDCNFICSRYALNLAKRKKLNTGIWNLIGTSKHGKFHTAFEIARVGGVHKNRSVKYDPAKLKPEHNICKLQNQAGTTIYCKSVNLYRENDKEDCYDVCTTVVNRVTDVQKIKGNWTLIGESYYGGSSRTGFEILVEGGTEVSNSATTETEYKDNVNLIDDSLQVTSSDKRFIINSPHKMPGFYWSCGIQHSQLTEWLTCKRKSFRRLVDCNSICSDYVLDLVRGKYMLDLGIWNIIGRIDKYEFKSAFEITKVRSALKRRSVKCRSEKLKSRYDYCKLENEAGTTIYCKTNSWDSKDLLDCYDACASFADRVIHTAPIIGNWTLIGDFYRNSNEGRASFEIIEGEAMDDSRTTTTVYTDTTTIGIEYTDTKTAVVGAAASPGPISRSSDIQADRVVVEMPGSLAVDQDMHFALSLVPMLRQRTLKDKLDVEIDILNYFKSKLANRTP